MKDFDTWNKEKQYINTVNHHPYCATDYKKQRRQKPYKNRNHSDDFFCEDFTGKSH